MFRVHTPIIRSIRCCSWWWVYVPETCRVKNTLIKLPCCIKLAVQIISVKNTLIKLPCCIKLAIHIISWGRCTIKQPSMHQCLNLFYFWKHSTIYVSDGLSVHHQEINTVHTATGICLTDTSVCLLTGRQLYLYSLDLLMMEGKTVRNM